MNQRPSFSKTPGFAESLCQSPPYTCLEIIDGNTWENLWPDETQRDLMRRLNRMNIKLRPGMILAVPNQLESLTLTGISPLALKIENLNEKKIVVHLTLLAWGAYDEKGELINWGPVSGGKKWCPDVGHRCLTPTGDFSILYKGGARCKSSRFPVGRGGAPMPYCMFFKKGYALHGSPQVPGYPASHGCVRMFSEDAKWLNETFKATQITILP